jgi:hypothetical protein
VLSATALDFGTMLVGESAFRTLTVANDGEGSLVGAASLSCPGYELVSGGGPFSLQPGDVWTLEVRFTPVAEGEFPCTLDLGGEAPTVQLVGLGAQLVAGAQCALEPPSLDFGFVPVGGSGGATFVIRSVGSAPLTVNVVSNAPGVIIVAGGGPDVLDPGLSKTVTVSFEPTLGGQLSGGVVIGPGCPDVTVAAVGTSVSFAADVYPILSASCRGCHYTPFAGTNISAASAHSRLVAFPAPGYSPRARVEPFDLGESVLYGKLSDTGQFGQIMPPGGALLSAAQRNTIRQWILEGATNN